MKKLFSAIGKTLLCVLAVATVLLLGVRLVDGIAFAKFYANSSPVFATPDITKGYVPQGVDYDDERGVFLATGYMSNGKASRVYIIDEDGETRFTELKKENGDDYTGHTGGISHNGAFVYITGANGIDIFSYTDILDGKTETAKLGSVCTYNDPAYCHIRDGYLYTGSFYFPDDYETPAHERVTTPAGDENTGLITVFRLDDNFLFGIEPAPKAVISTRMAVQGVCFTDDNKVVLSTSYGLSASKLFVYDLNALTGEYYDFVGTTKSGDEFSFAGITRYYLDSASLVETIKAPPMSEELVYLDGKIYVMNESACNKYIFGKFTTGLHVRAYEYKKGE